MNVCKAFLPLAFSSLMLAGCGGGSGSGSGDGSPVERIDYSGTNSAAVLTDDNAETFAASSSEVLASRLQYTNDNLDIPVGIQVSGVANSAAVDSAIEALTLTVQSVSVTDSSLPVAVRFSDSINGSCGGSMIFVLSGDENNGSGTITFNNYCDDGMITKGKIRVNFRTTATQEIINMEFSSLTVLRGSETITMSGFVEAKEDLVGSGSESYISVKANYNGRKLMIASREICTSFNNCTDSYYIKSAAGDVYRLDDFSVYQSGNLLDADGEFYHPTLGYVDINGSDLAVCDGSFSSGTIVLRDATQVLTIEFSSCGQYTTNLSSLVLER